MCTGKRQTHIRNAPSLRTAVTGIGPYTKQTAAYEFADRFSFIASAHRNPSGAARQLPFQWSPGGSVWVTRCRNLGPPVRRLVFWEACRRQTAPAWSCRPASQGACRRRQVVQAAFHRLACRRALRRSGQSCLVCRPAYRRSRTGSRSSVRRQLPSVDGVVDRCIDRQRQLPDGETGFTVFVRRSAGFDPVFAVGRDGERAGSAERHLGAVLAFEDGIFRVLVCGIHVVVVLLAVGKHIDRSGSRLDRDLRGSAAGDGRGVRARERQTVQDQRYVRRAIFDLDGAVGTASGQAVDTALGDGQCRPVRLTAAAGYPCFFLPVVVDVGQSRCMRKAGRL